MDQNHKELVEKLFTGTSFTLSEGNKIVPTFFMILPDNKLMPVVTTETIALKEYASITIRYADEMNAEALILICEQYMVSKKKYDPILQSILAGKIKPSDHPDRKSYLTVNYMSAIGETETIISEIHSDLKGTRYNREHSWLHSSLTNIMVPWR